MIFLQYKKLYPQYFNQEMSKPFEYLYGSVGKWFVVYKKVFFTKLNDNRTNIHDSVYAEYRANKLKVELIFEKINPQIKTDAVTYPNFSELVKYTVGKKIKNIKGNILCWKSYIPAYYHQIVENDQYGIYSGSFFSWYECGRRSAEGQYLDGEKTGKWLFWYHSVSPKEPLKKSFDAVYVKGNLVEMNEG